MNGGAGSHATPADDAPERLGWSVPHLAAQLVVLLVAAAAALVVTWSSPIYQQIFAAIPALVLPGGVLLPAHVFLPPLVPVLLGVPLALTRYRAPLLLWVVIMTAFAALGVLEVARLNWAAFVAGIAFRVESGPVPLVRSAAGLLLVLSGVLLLAHQSVHHHVALLAERGVPRPELAVARRRLLRQERLVVLGAGGAGLVLLLVAALSMHLTERAPADDPLFLPALLWVAALTGALAATFAFLAWRQARTGSPSNP